MDYVASPVQVKVRKEKQIRKTRKKRHHTWEGRANEHKTGPNNPPRTEKITLLRLGDRPPSTPGEAQPQNNKT